MKWYRGPCACGCECMGFVLSNFSPNLRKYKNFKVSKAEVKSEFSGSPPFFDVWCMRYTFFKIAQSSCFLYYFALKLKKKFLKTHKTLRKRTTLCKNRKRGGVE